MLLYPGGVREAFKRRGESYRLFWPARAEFVRMAARAGAVILPLAAVGADESLGLLLDSDEIRANPLLNRNNRVEADAARYPRVRCAPPPRYGKCLYASRHAGGCGADECRLG